MMATQQRTSSDRTARQLLREATSANHNAVDQVFGSYTLSEEPGYADFLQAQAAAFLPVEDAIDRSAPDRAVPDWEDRRRSHLLRADLAALGRTVPAFAPLPAFSSPEATLGAIYVLEGSRLGGTLLSRSVAPGAAKSFLSSGNSSLWQSLLAILEAKLVTQQDREMAVEAARKVFKIFEEGAQLVAARE